MRLSLAHGQGELALDAAAAALAAAAQTDRSETGAAPRLGYLVSRYPAVSHTFILREILQLRQAGFEIHTASVNAPDRRLEEMSADEAD